MQRQRQQPQTVECSGTPQAQRKGKSDRCDNAPAASRCPPSLFSLLSMRARACVLFTVLDLSPAVVASHRAGWTRLVSVRAFAADHAALQSQLRAACQTLDSQAQLPDLNVDDLRIDTPFQAIEKQIEKEVVSETRTSPSLSLPLSAVCGAPPPLISLHCLQYR